jgi:hypothetical protein
MSGAPEKASAIVLVLIRVVSPRRIVCRWVRMEIWILFVRTAEGV